MERFYQCSGSGSDRIRYYLGPEDPDPPILNSKCVNPYYQIKKGNNFAKKDTILRKPVRSKFFFFLFYVLEEKCLKNIFSSWPGYGYKIPDPQLFPDPEHWVLLYIFTRW
jgi:hypothetical protein